MRNLLMIVLVAVALLCVCRPTMALDELIAFSTDVNGATTHFLVVNAVDGNVLVLKDDVNYIFERWSTRADANYFVAPAANRHALGLFIGNMPSKAPACRFYTVLVKGDSNSTILYSSPTIKRWDGTHVYISDVSTIKGQDPNQVIDNTNRKQYNPGLTAQ
jgi:hypothetical protein